jgi:surfactin synthase thioesterase subunit
MSLQQLWLPNIVPSFRPIHRLFCFPYAGGGSSVYAKWRKFFEPYAIEVCAVCLPGREARLMEPTIHQMQELISMLVPALKPSLDIPYSIFGHSMGALIGYELSRALVKESRPLPDCLFVSAAQAPHHRTPDSLHTLADHDFLNMLSSRYQALPREVFEDRDLRELVTPILKGDFELIEKYRFQEDSPLPVKIKAFGGNRDNTVSPDALEHWRDLTLQSDLFETEIFEGDHFFLNHEGPDLTASISRTLTQR